MEEGWGAGGEEGRAPLVPPAPSACSGWHSCWQGAELPGSPGPTVPGDSGIQMISIMRKLTGMPQAHFLPKVNDGPSSSSLTLSFSPPSFPTPPRSLPFLSLSVTVSFAGSAAEPTRRPVLKVRGLALVGVSAALLTFGALWCLAVGRLSSIPAPAQKRPATHSPLQSCQSGMSQDIAKIPSRGKTVLCWVPLVWPFPPDLQPEKGLETVRTHF